jgi:hypothetical protein
LILEEADGRRADLGRRMRRLNSVTTEAQFMELEQVISQIEAKLLPASLVEEERRVRTLASLLEMAGVPTERAAKRAEVESDKPENWDVDRARLVGIIQEEIAKSGS